MNLRDRLDAWRLSRGWTIQQFADEVGVHQGLVSRWLHLNPKRRVTPKKPNLHRLAEVTGIAYEELRDLADPYVRADKPKAADFAQSEIEARALEIARKMHGWPRELWGPIMDGTARLVEGVQPLVVLRGGLESPAKAAGEAAPKHAAAALAGGSGRRKRTLIREQFALRATA